MTYPLDNRLVRGSVQKSCIDITKKRVNMYGKIIMIKKLKSTLCNDGKRLWCDVRNFLLKNTDT